MKAEGKTIPIFCDFFFHWVGWQAENCNLKQTPSTSIATINMKKGPIYAVVLLRKALLQIFGEAACVLGQVVALAFQEIADG